jgi:hypothetical protein
MNKFWMSLSLIGLCALLVAAESSPSSINEKTARRLAVDQYNHLFGGAYLSLKPSTCVPFPHYDAGCFHDVRIKDGCWNLVMDPPQGWYLLAKVSLDGKWVQITSAGFSPD